MESLLLSFGSAKMEWQGTLLSLTLAFLLSSLIAVVYQRTFKGLSWSNNLLQAMILGSMVASLIMIAIGDNIARGIGIVGSLAIIRFRTNLRDPRDLIFLFASLGVGVSSGVQSYSTAIMGALMFCAVAIALQATRFGELRSHDGVLRFQVPLAVEQSSKVAALLGSIPNHFALITKRTAGQGTMMEYAYQVRFREDGDCDRLIGELERIPEIRGLVYMNAHTTVEM
ncbi:MAG: DUF4956 domain-containing protein [Myxococcota bacterium]|jgi:uncharacterized membrane protein YhiD involved in acid resistance